MPKTILLADDSVTIRKVVEMTFQDTDIHVEAVGTGREALEKIAAIQPDLVLADVVMPEPSGYEICRTVKSSGHPVPVLLLAGTFEAFDLGEARACGADGHIVKPFESRALRERVEDLLYMPAPVPPAQAQSDELEAVLDELARADAFPSLRTEEEPADPTEPLDWLLGPETAAVVPEEPEAESATEEAVTSAPLESDPSGRVLLGAQDIEAIARAVVERLSEKVLREIAWEVVPDLAESIIRERIRELEHKDTDGA